jgi:hypothetical protein
MGFRMPGISKEKGIQLMSQSAEADQVSVTLASLLRTLKRILVSIEIVLECMPTPPTLGYHEAPARLAHSYFQGS